MTTEDLIARGYKPDRRGATKQIGDFVIAVGCSPPCVIVRAEGLEATIFTAGKTLSDLAHLERLLGEGAFVDPDGDF